MEDRISQVEDYAVRTDSTYLRALQLQERALQEKAIDMENCLRHNHMRILNLPEHAEGSRWVEFTESFLAQLLHKQDLPPTFVVEQPHKVPPTPPVPGAPTRPFLLRILNYRNHNRILAAAVNKADLQYENSKILLFPDHSPEIQRRRRSFTEVRRRLREKAIKFSLLYPSRI